MDWTQKQPLMSYNDNDDILIKLLKVNGINNPKEFFKPSEKNLHDPMLLDNIDEVTDKIIDSIKNKHLIGISADADTDGILSCAIMYRYLNNFTENIYCLYCNERNHGIEFQLEMLKPETKLLIIVDSSTNSIEACETISKKGVEVVILDHHLADEHNSHALIVNPYLCDYPNKEICGAGVVWKTLQVLDNKLNTSYVNNFIDLVGCALVADVMDVSVLENRYLIDKALKNINNLGLRAILDVLKPDEVNSQTIGYGVAPFINGAIRLNQTKKTIDLFLSDNIDTCKNIANELKIINDKRKTVEDSIFKETLPEAEKQANNNDKVIIIPYNKEINTNFNGLIATKIANKFQKPTIFMNEKNGYLKGSYRSYGDLNMQKLLNSIDLIDYAKGHNLVGGTGWKTKNLDIIKQILNQKLSDKDFVFQIEYDLEINSEDITDNFINRIKKYDFISGKGFPQAKFRVKNLFIQDKKVMGKNDNTIKYICGNIELLKFRTDKEWKDEIDKLDIIEVVGTLNLNKYYNWSKRKTIVTKQVFVDDIRLAE